MSNQNKTDSDRPRDPPTDEKPSLPATGFLTSKDIDVLQTKTARTRTPLLDPYDLYPLDGTMYDMRLGTEVYVSDKETPTYLTDENPFVVIRPGDFALLTTLEYLRLPTNILGLLSLKFSWASRGLVNISGFHVDPGYKGRIIFSVQNSGPNEVVLKFRDRVFMIMLYRIHTDVEPHLNNFDAIPLSMISSVRGPPISLRHLDRRLTRAETRLTLVWTLFISVLGAVIVLLLTHPP